MISKLDGIDKFVARRAPTIRFLQPLLNLNAAQSALNLETGKVIALIEGGQWRWAWNVSPAKRCREIRILARSVADDQDRIIPARMPEDEEFRAGCELILPGSTPLPGIVSTGRACGLARRLAVDSQGIHQLLRDGEIEQLKPARASRGCNASPEVKTASLEAFLKRRRVA